MVKPFRHRIDMHGSIMEVIGCALVGTFSRLHTSLELGNASLMDFAETERGRRSASRSAIRFTDLWVTRAT